MKRIYLFIVAAFLTTGLATANTYTVTNTYDSGAGSLRQAIIDANANSGADAISFNILGPGAGPYFIQLNSSLPAITGQVTINGYTEPNSYVATSSYPAKIMIVVDGNNTALVGFQFGDGITAGQADGSVIRGLSIINFAFRGILTYASNVTISGNYLGLWPDGSNTGSNNIGILMIGSDNCTIGGATADARNIISYSGSYGIEMIPPTGNPSTGNTIRMNYIGLDPTGATAKGNGSHGIYVSGTAAVVSSLSILDNFISSNTGNGIYLDGGSSANINTVSIKRNTIGLNLASASSPNKGSGILVNNATAVTIGGAPADKNTIASNESAGVFVTGSSSSGVEISYNSIYQNTGLGIDLGTSGVTANDTGDPDTGPNTLQNFPVITAASVTGTDLTITGSINSTSGTELRLEFFNNPSYITQDASSFGEGNISIGTQTLTTDGSGNAPFTLVITNGAIYKDYITATATATGTKNTSEFSHYFQVTETADEVCSTSLPELHTYSIPEVTGATSYTWSVPAGSSISTGSDTHEITVLYTSIVNGTYEVCVTASNNCGTSPNACFPILVKVCCKEPDVDAMTAAVCSGTATGVTLPAFGKNGASITSYDITANVQSSLTGTATTGTGLTGTGVIAANVFTNSTTSPLTVIYTVTPHSNACTGAPFIITVTVNPIPATPAVSVSDYCNGTSTLTASGYTGTLLWSTGATTASITVSTTGTYTVTQTIDGCTSLPGSGNASPKTTPEAPSTGTITQPTCALPTGSVVLNGLPPGSWTINPGAITGSGLSTTISGLAPEDYSFTVTNADGCTSSGTGVTILAKPNCPPVAGNDMNSTLINTPVNGTVMANDYDPDGDIITATPINIDTDHGHVILNTDGTYTYTPANGYTGPDHFTYAICDPSAACATARVDITISACLVPPARPTKKI